MVLPLCKERGGFLDHRARSLSTVSRATLRPSRQEERLLCAGGSSLQEDIGSKPFVVSDVVRGAEIECDSHMKSLAWTRPPTPPPPHNLNLNG